MSTTEGGETAQHASQQTPTSRAARALGVDESRLGVVSRDLSGTDAQAVGHALGQLAHDGAGLADGAGGGSARWGAFPGAHGDVVGYTSALVLLQAGALADVAVVARLHEDEWGHHVELLAPLVAIGRLATSLRTWVEHVTGPGSFLRLGHFEVRGRHNDLVLERWDHGHATRADLLLPPSVWQAVDRHTHGPLRLAGILAAEGLASSSGVLLVGPPGTGKSQLSRVVAAELDGTATVLVPRGHVARYAFRRVFDLAAQVAPTLVVLDDLDLVLGSRGAEPELLHEFLNTMDLGLTGEHGVVVLASTNDPSSIDPAAIRASRFDAVVEMSPPELEGRVLVLRRYLSRFPDVDLVRVASATEGATGADLRDVARRAVLATEGEVTTRALLDAVADGAWVDNLVHGAYL